MKNQHRGLFIAFEGGEGSGKSTQARLLTNALRNQGRVVTKTAEPGGTSLGSTLRYLLLNPIGDTPINRKAEALMFAADRAQHVEEVIQPRLEKNVTVITDRYMASSIAYQSFAGGLDRKNIESISKWASDDLKPDITFFLDVTPLVGLERKAKSNENTKFEEESLEYHRKVRKGFLEQIDDSWVVLDAEDSVASLHLRIVSHVLHVLHVVDGYRFTEEDVEKASVFGGASTKPGATAKPCTNDDCDNPYHQYGHYILSKDAEKPSVLPDVEAPKVTDFPC